MMPDDSHHSLPPPPDPLTILRERISIHRARGDHDDADKLAERLRAASSIPRPSRIRVKIIDSFTTLDEFACGLAADMVVEEAASTGCVEVVASSTQRRTKRKLAGDGVSGIGNSQWIGNSQGGGGSLPPDVEYTLYPLELCVSSIVNFRTSEALEKHLGVVQVKDLIRFSREEVAAVDGLGQIAVDQIVQRLGVFRLKLRKKTARGDGEDMEGADCDDDDSPLPWLNNSDDESISAAASPVEDCEASARPADKSSHDNPRYTQLQIDEALTALADGLPQHKVSERYLGSESKPGKQKSHTPAWSLARRENKRLAGMVLERFERLYGGEPWFRGVEVVKASAETSADRVLSVRVWKKFGVDGARGRVKELVKFSQKGEVKYFWRGVQVVMREVR